MQPPLRRGSSSHSRQSTLRPLRTLARRACITLAGAYLLSVSVLVASEELLLRFHDRGQLPAGSGRDVWLQTEDGIRIYARYYERGPSLPTLLYLHDNVHAIRHVSVPKLLIHSRSDEVVPFEMAQALWSAAPAPKRHLWLDGVGHNETFYLSRNEATRAMREFLASL